MKIFYQSEHKMFHAFDQDLLWKFIWPLAKIDSVHKIRLFLKLNTFYNLLHAVGSR